MRPFSLVIYTIFAAILAVPILSSNVIAERIWQRTVHDGRAPFTPAQTKTDCVKWAYPWPGAKICIGHRNQCKFLYSKISIWISGDTNEIDAKNRVKECGDKALNDGIFVAIPTTIASGGTKGFNSFLSSAGASFKRCVISINSRFIIGYDNPTHWGQWEG